MSPEECWAMLEASVNGTLVTLRKDGRPIALPVWFVVLDHKIYISTRGKKLTRVRNDKRCAFLVEAGERWAELRAVHVECEGRVIDPSADLTARMAAAMSDKYAAYRTASQAMPAATRQHYNQAVGGIIELEPVGKLLNWDNRRLGVS
jgi:hypothetical protein